MLIAIIAIVAIRLAGNNVSSTFSNIGTPAQQLPTELLERSVKEGPPRSLLTFLSNGPFDPQCPE